MTVSSALNSSHHVHVCVAGSKASQQAMQSAQGDQLTGSPSASPVHVSATPSKAPQQAVQAAQGEMLYMHLLGHTIAVGGAVQCKALPWLHAASQHAQHLQPTGLSVLLGMCRMGHYPFGLRGQARLHSQASSVKQFTCSQ